MKKESKNTADPFENKLNLPSYNGDAPYLFVSYCHADTATVRATLLELTACRYRFWYDDTMEVGKDFRDSLRERILNCAGFLAFFSEGYFDSKYCGMELLTAIGMGKKILPVYMKGDVKYPKVLEGALEHVQHVQIVAVKDSKNFQKSLASLLESLPKDTRQSLEVKGDKLFRCTDASAKISIPDSKEPGVPGVTIIDREAFRNCETLEEIVLGDRVRRLRKESFRGCKALSSLLLPKGVEHVGESAFRDCVSMTSLVVENPNIEICDRAFENCASLASISLPRELTEIYGGVFNSCKNLESIELPSELTVLGESSFADCSKLSEVEIPASVTKIDDLVFSGCSKLARVVFRGTGDGSSGEPPCSLTKIGKNAFKDCRSLTVFEIPRSVTSIGSGPFRGCSSLKKIVVMPGNHHYKEIDGVLFNKSRSVLICYPACKRATTYEIPDSVTTISDWAFCESDRLQDVVIPDSVMEIGEGAFHMCTALRTLRIPDSVERIDDTAFRGCLALSRIEIPDSVTEFGWGVFNGCTKLLDGSGCVVCPDDSVAARYCEAKHIQHVAP